MNPREEYFLPWVWDTERRYAFNFLNLLQGKIGTIGKDDRFGITFINLSTNSSSEAEFRQPPCVTNYEDCVMWVEFGASFILAAMQYGISLNYLRLCEPDVAGLAKFIRKALIPGMNDEKILDRMFARASGSSKVQSVNDTPSINSLSS